MQKNSILGVYQSSEYASALQTFSLPPIINSNFIQGWYVLLSFGVLNNQWNEPGME